MKQTAWILVFLSASVLSAQADEVEQRRIEVVGTGTIAREADQARISFAVETQAKTAKEAADLNAVQTTRLMAALKASGIQNSDLRTRHYRLAPRYRTDERGRQTLDPEGFIANNTVEVVERRLNKIGTLIDTAIEAGANRIGGINFELSQPQSARREALAAAVNAAKLDAGVIARASGQKLGQIIEIRSTNESPGFRAEGMMMSVRKSDTPIEAGTIHSTLGIDVVDRLRDDLQIASESMAREFSISVLVTARVTVRFQLQD